MNATLAYYGHAPSGPRAYYWHPDFQPRFSSSKAMPSRLSYRKMRTPVIESWRCARRSINRQFRFCIQRVGVEQPAYARSFWGGAGGGVVEEFDWRTNTSRAWYVRVGATPTAAKLLWSHRLDTTPEHRTVPMTESGDYFGKLAQTAHGFLVKGEEISSPGILPFVAQFDSRSHRMTPLFVSSANAYEEVEATLDDSGQHLLVRAESETHARDLLCSRSAQRPARRICGSHSDVPEALLYRQQTLQYERDDGQKLTSQLYLPRSPGTGGKLPLVLWGYPARYSASSQIGSKTALDRRFAWRASRNHRFAAAVLAAWLWRVVR